MARRGEAIQTSGFTLISAYTQHLARVLRQAAIRHPSRIRGVTHINNIGESVKEISAIIALFYRRIAERDAQNGLVIDMLFIATYSMWRQFKCQVPTWVEAHVGDGCARGVLQQIKRRVVTNRPF